MRQSLEYCNHDSITAKITLNQQFDVDVSTRKSKNTEHNNTLKYVNGTVYLYDRILWTGLSKISMSQSSNTTQCFRPNLVGNFPSAVLSIPISITNNDDLFQIDFPIHFLSYRLKIIHLS